MRRVAVADVGGTHARFALAQLDGNRVASLGEPVTLKTAEQTSALQEQNSAKAKLELKFALAYSRDEFAEALEALRAGTIDVTPLVTDVIGLADVPEAFRALERPTTQCKVLIEFP